MKFEGNIRWKADPFNTLVSVDRPMSVSSQCSDLDHIPYDSFMRCLFKNLKPNRNYTASVVAVNKAGDSLPAVFEEACLTSYKRMWREVNLYLILIGCKFNLFLAPSYVPEPVVIDSKFEDSTVQLALQTLDELNGPIRYAVYL